MESTSDRVNMGVVALLVFFVMRDASDSLLPPGAGNNWMQEWYLFNMLYIALMITCFVTNWDSIILSKCCTGLGVAGRADKRCPPSPPLSPPPPSSPAHTPGRMASAKLVSVKIEDDSVIGAPSLWPSQPQQPPQRPRSEVPIPWPSSAESAMAVHGAMAEHAAGVGEEAVGHSPILSAPPPTVCHSGQLSNDGLSNEATRAVGHVGGPAAASLRWALPKVLAPNKKLAKAAKAAATDISAFAAEVEKTDQSLYARFIGKDLETRIDYVSLVSFLLCYVVIGSYMLSQLRWSIADPGSD